MSVVDIANAAVAILQTAVSSVNPMCNVILGHPNSFADPTILYLYHQGYAPDINKGPGIVWRDHQFAIHLMVRKSADRPTTELLYLQLHDAITNAFYASATVRTLNGTALTSQLKPLSSAPGGSTPYTATPEAGEYRQQWWQLEARDQFVFDWR